MRTIRRKVYTERRDLQMKMLGREQYVPGTKKVAKLFIRTTSGTTAGTPAVFLMRFALNKKAKAFYDYAKPLMVVSARNSTGLLWAQTILNQYKSPTRLLFLNKKDIENPLISSVIADFKPKEIHSMVHVLNFFVDTLQGKGIRSFNRHIETVHVSGELPPVSFMRKIARVFPRGNLVLRYAATELGTVAIHCRHLAKIHTDATAVAYHPVQPVSIVEQNEEGIGEIAVSSTTLGKYLTGDAGKLVQERCICGSRKTLFLYGRVLYDIAHCVGATFHIAELERIFSMLQNYVENYYVEVREIEVRGRTLGSITVKIIPSPHLQKMRRPEEFVADFIERNLQLTKTRCLRELVNAGIFIPPEVILLSSLPKGDKKIRMRKVFE